MWLPKAISMSAQQEKQIICGGSTNDYKVVGDCLHKDIPFVFPYGVFSLPENKKDIVLLNSGETPLCIGTVGDKKDILQGETILYSGGGAYIRLCENGNVVINGLVIDINGNVEKGV